MIKVNKEICIGCGTCAAICDKVFKINEDEFKAEVIDESSTEDCVQEAIEACPVDAISKG
ncbi:MAG: ferredoxin [Patescibacteria group bacterium]|jgi:ferredoxin